MRTSTIIKIDVIGFAKSADSQSPQETAEFIQEYYSAVSDAISTFRWEFIKGIGDGVLVDANDSFSRDNISQLKSILSEKYAVKVQYRVCDHERAQIDVDSYSCNDVFGADINSLFRNDSSTVTLD